MPNLGVFISGLFVGDGGLHMTGTAVAEGTGVDFGWQTLVPWNSSAAATNQAARDAAIAAAAVLGIVVGPGDNKLVFAGAQTP